MTLKEELAQAQARITQLEGEAAGAATAKEEICQVAIAHVATIDELNVKLTAATTKADLDAALIKDNLAAIAVLEAKVAELESEKISVAEAADVKAREIAARNGSDLPAKKAGAGDKTIDHAEAVGTPLQRLAQIFEPKL